MYYKCLQLLLVRVDFDAMVKMWTQEIESFAEATSTK